MKDFYQKNYFFIRRLHSLLGIIPIGAFFLVHMALNSRAFQSPAQYEWVPDALAEIPFVIVIEIGCIMLPILFHAILGAVIVWQGDLMSNKPPYSGWYENWAYLLQRWSGVLLFVGLIVHVATTWGYKLKLEAQHALPEDWIFPLMQGYLENGWWLTFYILLVLLSAYHFGNGIFNFMCKWGASTSTLSQRYALWVGLLVGMVGLVLGYASIYGLVFKEHAGEVHTILDMLPLWM